MRFTSQASSGGVFEQSFSLGEVPGVLWTPEGADGTRPVILMGHGGGQHKKAPDSAPARPATGGVAWLRAQCLALFDALGSADKTLHANPGRHGDLPSSETGSSLRFFARHLGSAPQPLTR